ncbi:MAG: hypothetical protein ACREIP_19565, partial [Alphaproteobacteria bacterium]
MPEGNSGSSSSEASVDKRPAGRAWAVTTIKQQPTEEEQMSKFFLPIAGALCGAVMSLAAAAPASADTLSTVKGRGTLNCTGHNGSYPGLAEVDDKGNWKGLDIDLCRAVASAVFGAYENHLTIVPISWAQRWPMLQ